MELTEAVQRIVRHHLLLISALVVLALCVPLAIDRTHVPMYEATARMDFDPGQTGGVDQGKTLSDTALAIASSPGHTAAALDAVHADRDPLKVAAHHLTVEPVGTSGVLELSVTDKDRDVAARIANALAHEIVDERTNTLLDPSRKAIRDIDTNLRAAQDEITYYKNLPKEKASTTAATSQFTEAVSLQSDLERNKLALQQAQPDPPKIIDEATPPPKAMPRHLKSQLAIAGLLGLVLGLAIAALLEAMQPTIANADALARELGAPLVGRLADAPQHLRRLGQPSLATYLQLAAAGAGVETVQLVSVGPDIDLDRLVTWLQQAVGPSPDIVALNFDPQQFASWRDSEARRLGSDLNRVGLVVVSPTVVRRTELGPLEHLVAMSHWPLIGVIAYRNRRFSRSVPPDGPAVSGARPAVTVPKQSTASAS